MNNSNPILSKGQKETKILKLFDFAKLHRTQFTESGEILEIEMLKQIKHSNLIKYTDSGNILIDNQKLAYMVLDFVSGETLADKMKRENTLNLYEAKSIILSVLNGLNLEKVISYSSGFCKKYLS